MQTQIQCPQCSAPIVANVEQIIDVDSNPQLKQMLIGGALNMAQCRNCGWSGQVAMPLVYHDSEHDLLISFVPMELNMPYTEQERMMGQLVRKVVESVPQEKRRAYLLQPQQMMRWQTFIEQVLETEGITRDMIDRQRNQAELLRTLAEADKDVVDVLLEERSDEIDETFIMMVQQALQSATQAGQEAPTVGLSNLLARLIRDTEAGRRVEQRQLALRRLSRDAQQAGGVSPQMLAEHVVLNQEDDDVIDGLIEAVGTLNYEFFSALSAKIDEAAKSGQQQSVQRLTAVRTRLLRLYDEMRQSSEKELRARMTLINKLVRAQDKQALIAQEGNLIDELFLMALEQETEIAQQEANLDRSIALRQIRKLIDDMINDSVPPQIRFVMALLQAESDAQVRQLLSENPAMVSEELVEVMTAIGADPTVPEDLQNRLEELEGIVRARLAFATS